MTVGNIPEVMLKCVVCNEVRLKKYNTRVISSILSIICVYAVCLADNVKSRGKILSTAQMVQRMCQLAAPPLARDFPPVLASAHQA